MGSIVCPICRSAEVEVESQRIAEIEKGRPTSFWEEFSRCTKCGETFYTREQSLASSQAHAAAVRKANNLLSPDEIRAARLSLNLTQERFEEALGVGKKTVVRWERGTVAPSPGANGLLWVAAHYPGVFLKYAQEHSPEGRAAAPGGQIVASIELAVSPTSPPKVTRFKAPNPYGAEIKGSIGTGPNPVLQTSGSKAGGPS